MYNHSNLVISKYIIGNIYYDHMIIMQNIYIYIYIIFNKNVLTLNNK